MYASVRLKWLCILLTGLVALVRAEAIAATCARSCDNCLASVPFDDTDMNITFAERRCSSRLTSVSTFICLQSHCPDTTRNEALELLNSTCQETVGVFLPPYSIISNYSQENIKNLRRIRFNETFENGETISHPVVPEEDYFGAWLETLDAWEFVARNHYLYGVHIVVFWVMVVAFGVVNRIYVAVSHSMPATKGLRQIHYLTNNSSKWFKRTVTLPAAFGYRCAQRVWWSTVPPRIQLLTLLAFLAINTVYSVIGYRIVATNYYFGSGYDQMLRYVSDRTGIMSFANFPVIWLFGMRNNVALWLTGWDFGTYNNFHRWTARIATLQAVIHSIGYTIIAMRYGKWTYLFSHIYEWYWMAGVAATFFMVALIPLSIYWIRRTFYEPFLLLHIGLSVLLLLFMLGHVSIFNGRYDMLFWIPVFIWVFDRATRLFRVAAFRPLHLSTTATITYDSSSNIVRLTAPLGNGSFLKPQPGHFFYLTIPSDCIWQSHPFTIASTTLQAAQEESHVEQESLLAAHSETHNHNNSSKAIESKENCMEFLIRPYDGFTSRLRELTFSTSSLDVVLDGPYGSSVPLHRYKHVCFIAGGTGIVTPISHLATVLQRGSAATAVTLHWAVREPAFVRTVMKHHLDTHLDSDTFELQLYMSSYHFEGLSTSLSDQVHQHSGRPNIEQIVRAAASVAGEESLAVVACGPDGLLDDARLAVIHALKANNCRIDYFQDTFYW